MKTFDFIAIDTEDNSAELMKKGRSGFEKKITQCAAIKSNGTRFHNRGNVQEFLQWLSDQKEQIIYAHNLQYDLGSLFGDSLDCLDITLVGGRLIKAVWGNKTFRDSFNMWPMALKKVGSVFKLEKGEFDANSKTYVFRDCEIVRRAIKFSQKHAARFDQQLPATYGGLGVKIWKSIGGENFHDSDEFSLQGYYGGRVEVFKQRCAGRIVYTDINSLYPFCLTQDFPDENKPRKDIECKFGIATVEIDIPPQWFCPLPVRRDDGSIIYPWGKFTGTWTIAEIRNAIDHFGAKVKKVLRCVGSDSGRKYYADFVNYTYSKRLAAKTDAERTFWKFILNSFYGRLGLSGKIGRSVNVTLDNIDEGVLYGKKVLVTYQMPLELNVNYYHVAHVTAFARIHLANFVRQIGEENMIYCDTDSTIFFCKDQIPFPIGRGLGQMKLEGEADSCEVWLPKTYRFADEYKAKGVPKSLAKEFICHGEAEFDLPFKIREAITFYDRGNRRKLSVWRRVQKIRGVNYDKKSIDGNRFFPLEFSGRSKERET